MVEALMRSGMDCWFQFMESGLSRVKVVFVQLCSQKKKKKKAEVLIIGFSECDLFLETGPLQI